MRAFDLLLKNKPEWAGDQVLLVAHLLDTSMNGRDWDQVFLHDGQLVDVSGKPLTPADRIYVWLLDGSSAPTLQEVVDNNAPSTPEEIGYKRGYNKAINLAKGHIQRVLNWMVER
jgi:hypothetical protein